MTTLDIVIVGAGQAGLGVSCFLQRDGRKHIVFERGGLANRGYPNAGIYSNSIRRTL